MRRQQYRPPTPASTLAVLATLTLLALGACSREGKPEMAQRAVHDDVASTSAVPPPEHATGHTTGRTAAGHAPTCAPPTRTGTIPKELSEASGLAVSRRHPGVLWSHNDSGHPAVLIAIDSTGRQLGRVRVAGARNRDWEDIALGPCPTGECLYLADTGDNRLRYEVATIYRVPEPAPGDTITAPAERFPLRYPNGPRDVEAIYLLPDGALYLVSKGRRHPIELYRYPPPLRAGETVTVEEIQRLTVGRVPLPSQATGATATPDGSWVAIRTYSAVQLYRPTNGGRLAPALPSPGLDLRPLAEPQGEGVAIRADGTLYLISEAGPTGVPGVVGRTHCELPAGIDGAPSMR